VLNRLHLSFIQQPGRVEKILAFPGRIPDRATKEHPYVFGMRFNLIHCLVAATDKIIELQKVPWRVPTDTQFGKNNQVCALFPGRLYTFQYASGILLKVANVVVLLSDGDFHTAKVLRFQMIALS
jgi:hypothetical protein